MRTPKLNLTSENQGLLVVQHFFTGHILAVGQANEKDIRAMISTRKMTNTIGCGAPFTPPEILDVWNAFIDPNGAALIVQVAPTTLLHCEDETRRGNFVHLNGNFDEILPQAVDSIVS